LKSTIFSGLLGFYDSLMQNRCFSVLIFYIITLFYAQTQLENTLRWHIAISRHTAMLASAGLVVWLKHFPHLGTETASDVLLTCFLNLEWRT